MVHRETGAQCSEQCCRPSKCQQLLLSLLFETAECSSVLGSRDALGSQRDPWGPDASAEEIKDSSSGLESPVLGMRRQDSLCRLQASLGHMVRPCPNKELEWKNSHRRRNTPVTPALDRSKRIWNPRGQWRTGKMAQWVQVLAANPDDLSSIPRTFTVSLFPPLAASSRPALLP